MYSLETLLLTGISGALLGLVYALIAIGFTLLLGVIGYVNFAHGQLTMLAMYFVFIANESFGLDPFLAAPIVVLLCVALAGGIYASVGRQALVAAESTQVLVTIGLLLLIQSVAVLIWGPTGRTLRLPYETSVYEVLGLRLSSPLVWAAAVSLAGVLAVLYFLRRTDSGTAMRATAANTIGASLSGINTTRVFLAAMLLAGALEGLAGSIIAPLTLISPVIGFSFILKAFVIVVVSGMGSVGGALVVAVGLGIVEAYANLTVGSQLATATIFAVLIVAMLVRPAGLFATRRLEYA